MISALASNYLNPLFLLRFRKRGLLLYFRLINGILLPCLWLTYMGFLFNFSFYCLGSFLSLDFYCWGFQWGQLLWKLCYLIVRSHWCTHWHPSWSAWPAWFERWGPWSLGLNGNLHSFWRWRKLGCYISSEMASPLQVLAIQWRVVWPLVNALLEYSTAWRKLVHYFSAQCRAWVLKLFPGQFCAVCLVIFN